LSDSKILRLRLAVPSDLSGRGLSDILALAARIPEESAARMVRFGSVRVDGQVERDPGRRISAGSRVFVLWSPQAAATQPSPRLVFHDDHLWIVWKPAGIPVQGTRLGTGNSVEDYLAQTSRKGREPRIVHRLDLPVSGLMVAAATAEGAAGLSKGFEDGAVRKVYLAVVQVGSSQCAPLLERLRQGGAIELDQPLLWVSGRQRALVSADGKPARSRVALVSELGTCGETSCGNRPSPQALTGGLALLAIRLLSGRTHQIRVHLSHAGMPVVGDVSYGAPAAEPATSDLSHSRTPSPAAGSPLRTPAPTGAADGGDVVVAEPRRIALHSTFLAFPHPLGKGPVVFQELPPDDFWRCAGAGTPADLLNRFREILPVVGCGD